MATLSSHTTRASGVTLTATIYNEDHERHIANAEALNTELATKLTAADIESLSSIPIGGIIMWSGSIASIPTGWVLCNGLNGTPDLRNRMVIGAGSTYAVAATGGAATVTLVEANLPTHTHTFSGTTASDGSHTHSGSTNASGSHTHTSPIATSGSTTTNNGNPAITQVDDGVGSFLFGTAISTSSAGSHSHTMSITAAGAHTHTYSGTTSGIGSGTAHDNLPPYYALAFIMRTA